MGFENGILESPAVDSGAAGPGIGEYVGFAPVECLTCCSKEMVVRDEGTAVFSKLGVKLEHTGGGGGAGMGVGHCGTDVVVWAR